MKTPATKFEVQLNGKRFAAAAVNVEDQLEVNLVSVSGQESAILAITAFVADAPRGGNYVRSENAVLLPGDSLTVTLSAADDSVGTNIGPPDPELLKELSSVESVACSFCGKGSSQVGKLISGPSVFICDECVAMCQNIISDET